MYEGEIAVPILASTLIFTSCGSSLARSSTPKLSTRTDSKGSMATQRYPAEETAESLLAMSEDQTTIAGNCATSCSGR
jgi:hypothetical protein